ncbi:MAG: hypothetical protein ACKOFJ_00250 [Actinomycetota bacterium]
MSFMLRGRVAFVLKAVVLALISAVLLMLTQSAFAQGQYAIALFLAIAIILLNFTYFNKRTVPLKFFIPGILLLTAFVVTPILYTLVMSTYTYKTGNYISKEQAISRIQALAIEPDENGSAFDIVVGTYQGQSAILVSDVLNSSYFLSTQNDRIPLDVATLTTDENGVAQGANDFVATASEDISGSEAATLRFKFRDEYFISVESLNVGVVYRQSLQYLPNEDKF